MKIHYLLLILIIQSCSAQISQLDEYESYKQYTSLTFPSIVCDYYINYNEYPVSKQEFENYLSSREDGVLLQKILLNKKYSFKKNIQKNIFEVYDWGFDNDDDNLKTYYTLDSLNTNADGDLLLFYFSLDRCPSFKRKEESKVKLFSNKQIIEPENSVKLGYSKIVEDFIHKFVIDNYDSEDVYVPKDPNGDKKLSIIHFTLENQTWNSKLIKTEHGGNFQQLIPLLSDWLAQSEEIKNLKVDEIILPVRYYEMNQLEKL